MISSFSEISRVGPRSRARESVIYIISNLKKSAGIGMDSRAENEFWTFLKCPNPKFQRIIFSISAHFQFYYNIVGILERASPKSM